MRQRVLLIACCAGLFSCAAPAKPTQSEPRAAQPAPTHATQAEDPAARFVDLTLFAGDDTFSFAEACDGYEDQAGGRAFAGAAIKPKRPPHLWLTGCNGAGGYFHAIVERPPYPGPARTSLMLVALPGEAQLEIERAEFEVTHATRDRLAGRFAFELPRADGGTVLADGHFDVPRVADDTTPGP
jgi:hypothetical protein